MPSRSRSTMSAKSCPDEKTGPVGREDDARARPASAAERVERVDQLAHVRLGERVPPLGAVHRDGAESGVRRRRATCS